MVPAAYLKEQWFDRKRKRIFKGVQKSALKETPLAYFDIYLPNEMSKEANIFFSLHSQFHLYSIEMNIFI